MFGHLSVGQTVKVRIPLPINNEGVVSESPWVEITSLNPMMARIDNDLLYADTLGFDYDDVVNINGYEIVQVWRG